MTIKYKPISLSLLVLTRNEEKIVRANLVKILEYLHSVPLIKKFEILVCDFSEDSTPSIVKSMEKSHPELKYIRAEKRGIGAGIKAGIDNAIFELVMFYPIDMAWSIDIIEKSIMAMNDGADVVLGSRGLKESKVSRPFDRTLFSVGYNILVNVLFQLNIKDTQGTVAFRKHDVLKFRKDLEDNGAFLQTEILIYSKKQNLNIKEIPSNVTDFRKESKVTPISFSVDMMSKVFRKFWKLNFT